MRIRLADYVVNFLIEKGVKDCFSVVGGGAMHLNDAFGHNSKIRVTYNHHEQACAMAAESYARLNNKIACVCVTTGPGGINTLTGVACGWLDSIPMFIISGQVRHDTTIKYALKYTKDPLRSLGDQEFNIVETVSHMTKYAVMIEDPYSIKEHLEIAWFLATNGRPGPVWIDIPVDYQGMYIETNKLKKSKIQDNKDYHPIISKKTVNTVVNMVKNAKRPVLYAGYGIRLSGSYEIFKNVINKLNIPVVTYWNAIDLIENDNKLYCGRGGNMGDRPGNWAIQNSDLILAIGTRISIRQVGYNWELWAKNAKVIMVDIDSAEMKKHTIHVDVPIHADAKDFLSLLDKTIENKLFHNSKWLKTCNDWKKHYPVVSEKQKNNSLKPSNVYAFLSYLSESLPSKSLVAVSNGACCVAGSQSFVIKKGTRFINNSAIASMGYGLPAAIGLCISSNKKETICLEGDGSIMMNLQELQTIITNQLPIKLFLINNNGYHSIRITQTNLFTNNKKVGIGPESGDLSFPNYEKIAKAFGFKYFCAKSNKEMRKVIDKALSIEGPLFCEIFTDTKQVWEPKSSTKKLKDGSLVSSPLEDLAPFLPDEELERIMSISKE